VGEFVHLSLRGAPLYRAPSFYAPRDMMHRRIHTRERTGARRSRLRRVLDVCLLAIALLGACLSAVAPYAAPDRAAVSLARAYEAPAAKGARSHIQKEIDRVEAALACLDSSQSTGCSGTAQSEKCCDIACHTMCSTADVEFGSADVRAEPYLALPATAVVYLPSKLKRPPRA